MCNLIAEKKLGKTLKESKLRRSSLPNVVDLDVTFIKEFQNIKVKLSGDDLDDNTYESIASPNLVENNALKEEECIDNHYETLTVVPTNFPVEVVVLERIYDTVALDEPSEQPGDQTLLRHSSENALTMNKDVEEEPRVTRWRSLNPPIEPPMSIEAFCR